MCYSSQLFIVSGELGEKVSPAVGAVSFHSYFQTLCTYLLVVLPTDKQIPFH